MFKTQIKNTKKNYIIYKWPILPISHIILVPYQQYLSKIHKYIQRLIDAINIYKYGQYFSNETG